MFTYLYNKKELCGGKIEKILKKGRWGRLEKKKPESHTKPKRTQKGEAKSYPKQS